MTTTQQQDVTRILNYTDSKIANYYKHLKEDYNIEGEAKTTYNDETKTITVTYTEDGEQNTWSMAYYPEYAQSESISWVYDCWLSLC